MWSLIARLVVRHFEALRQRAMRTPYSHITSPDGSTVYMYRYWLFNPYPHGSEGRVRKWSRWLPSVRLHHIMEPDRDRHLHDHPWNARTIVLRGWYEEERPLPGGWTRAHWRSEGYTGRILFGQFHRISHVSSGGVWTMFITWRYRGTWGFDVDGVKVPYRTYLAERDGKL